MNKKIVHISNTPLVGAPGKISHTLNRSEGFTSSHIILNDYPKRLEKFFLGDSILYEKSAVIDCLCDSIIESADIIHIHNSIDKNFIEKIERLNSSVKKIYQVHSPLREGPLYANEYEILPFDFDKKLVVSHVHPRLYQDFTPVPNLITLPSSLNLLKSGETPRLLFLPAHKEINFKRFGCKYSPLLENNIKKLAASGRLEAILPDTPLSPSCLGELRKKCHFSIDEISTGGFHQVSIEGLCCGNVTINNADYFSLKMFSKVIGSEALPPFEVMSDDTFFEKMEYLLYHKEEIIKKQKESYDFYNAYLTPIKLINIFKSIYTEVLNV